MAFEVQSIYQSGTIIFDASTSKFNVLRIVATRNNFVGVVANESSSIMTLYNAPHDDYNFTITGDANGNYSIVTTCPPPTQGIFDNDCSIFAHFCV